MDLFTVILGLVIAYVLWKTFIGSARDRLIEKIPGVPAYPIIGNLFELMRPSDEIIPNALDRYKKYGPVMRFWAGPLPIVTVAKAEYVETILGSHKELKKSFGYRFIEPWLGRGLLTSFGPRWTKHRKMLTPTFHFKILDSFIPVYEQNTAVMLEILTEKIKSQDVVDVYPLVTMCALDIICETAMGINLKAQENCTSLYVAAVYKISNLITERFNRVYLHSDLLYSLTPSGRKFNECLKTLHNFTETVIKERKALRQSGISQSDGESEDGVKKRKAFLDLLLDMESDLTDTDIREEVDTFMFEGHDTTTAAISWTLYLLGRHPEIQEKVAEEILSLWPDGESLSMQALNDMKLLERVIKETLRIYPSVPFISRDIAEDMTFGKYKVPAKTTVNVPIVLLHRDPEVFPDPDKFDPDRFLPENVSSRHPYAYVPFSAGPRNCIGQKFAILEEKAVLASVIRTFKFTAVDENVLIVSELIERPKNGTNLKMFLRKN